MQFTLLQGALLSFLFAWWMMPSYHLYSQTDPNQPNILLIISDDLGVEHTNGYGYNHNLLPTTPTLDSLRSMGLTFKNTWSAPACTPTRAAIMSGKYGIKTGVTSVPGNLDTSHSSVFTELENQTGNAYADAVIGKWHISNPTDLNHPSQHNIDHYEGFFNSNPDDYYDWQKIINGVQEPNNTTEYTTSHLTNQSISWINAQSQPWFLWLAQAAPHAPFHVPPASLYTSNPTNTNKQKARAMIEAMDAEIGRLLNNIPTAVLNNTIVIYIGDNGGGEGVNQNYPPNHSKNTLYQGGIHVPMIVAGAGVTRQGEQEDALIHAVDIYASVLEIAGVSLPGGIYNSQSFEPLLSDSNAPSRPFNYSELSDGGVNDWTIRDAQYKLLQLSNGSQEFYDLLADSLETQNLIGSLTPAQETIKTALEAEAFDIRFDWSCQDLIQNGIETGIDTGCNTAPFVCPTTSNTSQTNIGCCQTPASPSEYTEVVLNGKRTIYSNVFPDHDYCLTGNNIPAPFDHIFQIPINQTMGTSPTSVLSSTNRPDRYFGIGLNGVLMAPAPALPFVFQNTNNGEYNWNWVFEPTNNQGSGPAWVGLDCASAHTGPQGYHYHGNMFEYAENIQTGISTTTTPPTGPIQIGWASDGYPILYRFAPDGLGGLALLQPSYQLKAGDRPGDGVIEPCGPYNGKYTNDYEYVMGSGDLDECNGIQRNVTLTTSEGVEIFDYFYVVTDAFPQISRCITGVPDESFNNSNKGSVPVTLRVFLEGAYSPILGKMTKALNSEGLIPLTQPYSSAPYNYPGQESVSAPPANMIDWVLVEQRSGSASTSKVNIRAGLLMDNGYIKDVDGISDLHFYIAENQDYHFVVRHRNHLDVMTATSALNVNTLTYDFSSDVNTAFGSQQLKPASDGTPMMFAGDMTSDLVIQTTDYDLWQSNPAILSVYDFRDINLDGTVQSTDYDLWFVNKAKLTPAELAY